VPPSAPSPCSVCTRRGCGKRSSAVTPGPPAPSTSRSAFAAAGRSPRTRDERALCSCARPLRPCSGEVRERPVDAGDPG
jgi:hypothetical protein